MTNALNNNNYRRASVAGLAAVDRVRKERYWTKKDSRWCEAAGDISEKTLVNFWHRRNNRRENFDRICLAVGLNPDEICELEAVDTTIEPSVTVESLPEMEIAVLDDERWVGRADLIKDLVNKLQNSHRVVLLLGITGIGKTALAESLVIRLRGNWSELRENFENAARPQDFVSVAIGWLNAWGERVSEEIKNDPARLVSLVVDKLCLGKYLLILDSIEYLLIADSQRRSNFADEWWASFWQGLLAAPTCKSKIIVTSQGFPVQLAAECDRYRNFGHQEILTGLVESEQREFFTKFGFSEEIESNESKLLLIGDIYDGHPLAMRVICGEIQAEWQSNISAYWRENGAYIEEVQTALKAAREQGKVEGSQDRWQLASYTVKLGDLVQTRITITFDRLKHQLPTAYMLICVASVYRCEVPESFWLSHLELRNFDLQQQKLAIAALRDRFLIEDCGFCNNNERLVAQHNLIRSVAISHRLTLLGEDRHNG